jgi:RNA polymerase sigma-70 factor (ECF subfamily)
MPDDDLSPLLESALASLPERRRQAFVLAHLHDLTYAQIAAILDRSPQTIANDVSRALADLRGKLALRAGELTAKDDVDLPARTSTG